MHLPELIILAPVGHPYRWLAGPLRAQLDACWPDHPPLYTAGLTTEEAHPLHAIPISDAKLPRHWCEYMRETCEQVRAAGCRRVYLVLEEHPPLGACHPTHLNETIPRWMDELGSSYISLLGWDHRRCISHGRLVDSHHLGLRRLDAPAAPRFQLHPALWDVEALITCLDLVLAAGSNHTPWAFENTLRRADVPLPPHIRHGCYSVCGAAMSARPHSSASLALSFAEHFLFRRAAGLVQYLPLPLKSRVWRALEFDHVMYEGPYPMYFGGVMSRGTINPALWRRFQREPARAEACQPLISAIHTAYPELKTP